MVIWLFLSAHAKGIAGLNAHFLSEIDILGVIG